MTTYKKFLGWKQNYERNIDEGDNRAKLVKLQLKYTRVVD